MFRARRADAMVALAQPAEHWIVAPEVTGSSPVGHSTPRLGRSTQQLGGVVRCPALVVGDRWRRSCAERCANSPCAVPECLHALELTRLDRSPCVRWRGDGHERQDVVETERRGHERFLPRRIGGTRDDRLPGSEPLRRPRHRRRDNSARERLRSAVDSACVPVPRARCEPPGRGASGWPRTGSRIPAFPASLPFGPQQRVRMRSAEPARFVQRRRNGTSLTSSLRAIRGTPARPGRRPGTWGSRPGPAGPRRPLRTGSERAASRPSGVRHPVIRPARRRATSAGTARSSGPTSVRSTTIAKSKRSTMTARSTSVPGSRRRAARRASCRWRPFAPPPPFAPGPPVVQPGAPRDTPRTRRPRSAARPPAPWPARRPARGLVAGCSERSRRRRRSCRGRARRHPRTPRRITCPHPYAGSAAGPQPPSRP